jgi:hypothetical protein
MTGSLEVYSTSVSWKFIGDSSPAVNVEGARRWAISACTTKLHSTAGYILRAVERRQARYEQAFHGVSAIPWGVQNETLVEHGAAGVLLHIGSMPSPEAPALVRGSGVSFSRWCSCVVLSLTVYSGVWGIG